MYVGLTTAVLVVAGLNGVQVVRESAAAYGAVSADSSSRARTSKKVRAPHAAVPHFFVGLLFVQQSHTAYISVSHSCGRAKRTAVPLFCWCIVRTYSTGTAHFIVVLYVQHVAHFWRLFSAYIWYSGSALCCC